MVFTAKLWELLFPKLEPWAWGPGVGLGHLTPQGGPLQPKYHSNFYLPYVTVGPGHFVSLSLLPI